MYCVKCGVKLSDGVSVCPLCHTKMNFDEENCTYESSYSDKFPSRNTASGRILFISIMTLLFTIGISTIIVVCFKTPFYDSWAGYVLGAILLIYIIAFLPFWFKKYNSYIFLPINHTSIAFFILYICIRVKGQWFFTFALPIVVLSLIIHLTYVSLFTYVKKGFFYIFGSLFISLGAFCVAIELLQCLTFKTTLLQWSLYVFTPSLLIGLFFILVGINKPLQNSIKKRFFI